MNKDQKKSRRRELRQRAKDRELKKSIELEEEDSDGELDVIETADTQVEVEGTEKDYGYPVDPSPYMEPAPTSFEELDQARQAREEAEKIMEVTDDTEYLVRNILRNPEMNPGEKVEAMSAVASGFGSRVALPEEDSKKEIDIDLLHLQAVIAHDRRNTNAAEFLGDVVTKAILTSARREKLSDDDFALVVTKDGKKVREYPVHDKAHVRNSMSRAAQMLKHGGYDMENAKTALPKIHSSAKKLGIGSSMEKERNAILIEKDASDQWRWVGWVSNNFIDWDGDIIAESAHKEYVDWWEKNQDVSPSFVSWHTPGTARSNPVDFMMYENGFLIMSGKLEEQEAAGLLKAQAECELGMSHGTFVFSRDPKDPRAIMKYRMYEASDLPLDNAANPFTDFETMVKEVGMDKQKYLATILGSEEKAKAFLEKTGLKQKALQDAQVESKELEVPAPDAPVDETPPAPVAKAGSETGGSPAPTPEEIVAKVMKEMDVEGLAAFVSQAKEAIDKVPVLEELIKALQGDQEEKLAEILTPPAARFPWSLENRPSQSDDNKVTAKEKEKATPGVPDGYWLSEATKTTPVAVAE